MTEPLSGPDTQPTPEELRAAAELCCALHGDPDTQPDGETMAVVRLFEALGATAAGDALAARRGRNRLVTAARWRRRSRLVLAWAAALVLATLAPLAWHRLDSAPAPELLAARETAARAAVAALARTDSTRLANATIATLEASRSSRVLTLATNRYLDSLQQSSWLDSGRQPARDGQSFEATPTPGGIT